MTDSPVNDPLYAAGRATIDALLAAGYTIVPPGTAPRPLAVGDVLYGYCGGVFGRDSYSAKTVEAIGPDWVVAREGSRVVFAAGDPADLTEYRTPEENP